MVGWLVGVLVLSVCLPVCLPACLPACLSVCLFVGWLVCLFVWFPRCGWQNELLSSVCLALCFQV